MGRIPFYSSSFCEYLRVHSHGHNNNISITDARISLSQLCNGDLDRNIVISIENIFGEFGHKPRMYHAVRPVLEELQLILPEHEIHIAYYVRRQDTFFESIYTQRVQKLHAQQFADFYAKRLGDDLRWTPILDEIQDMIGKDKLTVIPFESISSGVDLFIREMFTFISPLLVDQVVFAGASGADTNLSLSGKGINLALALFPELEKSERQLFMAFLKKHFSSKQYPKARLLDDQKRDYLLKQLSEDNALLIEKYLDNYPGKSFYTDALNSDRL